MSENRFPDLQTERLRLREIVPADAPALLAIHSDREAMRWFGTDPLQDLAQAEQLVSTFASWRLLPAPGTRWGLERKSDGQLIGSCGLFNWNRSWRRCILGYELARPAWGQGLMSEALRAVLAWGYSPQGMALNRVEAMIHAENAPSLKLAQQLGFQFEGRLRQVAFWDGRHHDLLMHARLASDQLPG